MWGVANSDIGSSNRHAHPAVPVDYSMIVPAWQDDHLVQSRLPLWWLGGERRQAEGSIERGASSARLIGRCDVMHSM